MVSCWRGSARLRSKQDKPDTANRWDSVRDFAAQGVPLKVFLHQRHMAVLSGRCWTPRPVDGVISSKMPLKRCSTQHGLSSIRTGSHNQADIAERFEVHVTPAPDFVVFDPHDDSLKAMLECKGTNNGGTARDKALRFNRLRDK